MAQLDRATVCGTVGRRFESSWARSFFHTIHFHQKLRIHLRERWPSGLRRTLGKRV